MALRLQQEGAPLSVRQLATELEALGVRLGPTPNKVVSDLLRTEVARGRVLRQGRGSYGPGRIPESTARFFRRRLAGASR